MKLNSLRKSGEHNKLGAEGTLSSLSQQLWDIPSRKCHRNGTIRFITVPPEHIRVELNPVHTSTTHTSKIHFNNILYNVLTTRCNLLQLFTKYHLYRWPRSFRSRKNLIIVLIKTLKVLPHIFGIIKAKSHHINTYRHLVSLPKQDVIEFNSIRHSYRSVPIFKLFKLLPSHSAITSIAHSLIVFPEAVEI